MLQGYLGSVVGLRYIEEQKNAQAVYYTDPGQLFLHGLIDTKQGTCGNMAALHVAISRRMGWPVSLACAKAHFISRYDDGEIIHNIEATSTHQGAFASDPDEAYLERFKLPKRAVECGSDLRKLTAREMVGAFLSLRARHHRDCQRTDLADSDYTFCRLLFPQYRHCYINGMVPMLRRGEKLFDRGELGHPDSFFRDLAPSFNPSVHDSFTSGMGAPVVVTPLARRANDIHVISIPFSSKAINASTEERVKR